MAEGYDDYRNREVFETTDHELQFIGFKEALELATSVWDEEVYGGGIDYCCETEDAYLFRRDNYLSFGGQGPVLVWKLGGGFGSYAVYNLEGGHEIVREGFLSEFGE